MQAYRPILIPEDRSSSQVENLFRKIKRLENLTEFVKVKCLTFVYFLLIIRRMIHILDFFFVLFRPTEHSNLTSQRRLRTQSLRHQGTHSIALADASTEQTGLEGI